MMVEGHGKQERYDEQYCKNQLIVRNDQQHRNSVSGQDDDFRGDYVCHDRSNKKSLLALEQRSA
jgi:hypothetical protein